MHKDALAVGHILMKHLLDDQVQLLARDPNSQMRKWAFAAARLFGFGDRSYKISHLYVEFENVASAGTAVTAPAIDTNSGREYYTNLASPRDYLRIPVRGVPQISIQPGNEDYFDADADEGDTLTIEGLATGAVGENGLTFSNGSNSKIFGVGLVASPDANDPTKDIVLHRGYYSTAKQKVVPSVGSLLVGWEIYFRP